jgi:hypothetical protein
MEVGSKLAGRSVDIPIGHGFTHAIKGALVLVFGKILFDEVHYTAVGIRIDIGRYTFCIVFQPGSFFSHVRKALTEIYDNRRGAGWKLEGFHFRRLCSVLGIRRSVSLLKGTCPKTSLTPND